MKKSLAIIILALSVALASAQETKFVYGTMKFQGETREYYVYLPKKLDESRPLMIMLHGHGEKMDGSPSIFSDAADRYGFVLCTPQGLRETAGPKALSWNVGYTWHEGWKVDDCAFVMALAKKLQKEYSLHPSNLIISGMSNGGEMCYYLAHRYPGKIAAIVSLAGLQMEWMYRKFKNDKSVAFCEIHGTDDKVSSWDGDPSNRDGWGKYTSVPVAVGHRVSVNRCTHEICDTLPLYNSDSHIVIRHSYEGGTDGKDVLLYEVVGGGHEKGEKDMDLFAEIWRFSKKNFKSLVPAGNRPRP